MIRDVYCRRINNLLKLQACLEKEDCDGPFLMSEPSDAFKNGKIRLLLIGQETNGWHGDLKIEIDEILDLYTKFGFGKNYNKPFFQYARSIAKKITGTEEFMWTNIFKFGRATGKGTPNSKVNAIELEYFNIICEEIEYLKPDCIVFLTGPNYDRYISERINDANFNSVSNYILRHFAKITSNYLPHHTYRIYHPGYGNRIKSNYDQHIDFIANAVKSQ